MFKLFRKPNIKGVEQMLVMYVSREKELHTETETGVKSWRTIKPQIKKLPIGHSVYEFNEKTGQTKQINPKVKNKWKVFFRMEQPVHVIEQVPGRMYVPAFNHYKATVMLKSIYRGRKDVTVIQ